MCSTKVKFLQRVDDLLKCPICENVYIEPWQTSCGHRFCLKCLESLLRSSCPRCPIDGKDIAKNTSFLDKCCEREVLNLQCCCRYEDRKCDWRGNFRQLQVNSFRQPRLVGRRHKQVCLKLTPSALLPAKRE